jgi:peptide/nickel transport system substrate-binding protein
MKKICYALVLIMLAVGTLSACSAVEAAQDSSQADLPASYGKKEVRIVYHFTTNTLDPAMDDRNLPVRSGSHETLTKIADRTMEITPWLAETWESEDAVNWIFTIRSGVTFQDGTPCDAAAVKASLERAISLSKSVKSALLIESMEAEGHKLKIVTSEPHPTLPSDLAFPPTAITKADAPDIESAPIGTGPYIITGFTPNAAITLTGNSDYWDGAPKLDSVVILMNQDANARLLALQSGEVDILMKPAVPSLAVLSQNNNYVIDSTVGIRDHCLLYNTVHPYVSSAAFRKGIDSLINRDEIVSSVMLGEATAAYGPFSDVFAFAPKYERRPFGTENALKYFEEAGLTVKDGKVTDNGAPIKLTFATYTSQAEFSAISQMIQANSQAIGIELEIKIIEKPDDWLPQNKADWDMSMFSLPAVPRGDASYYLNACIAEGGVRNYCGIDNSKINALIGEFNVTGDTGKRNELAKQVTEIIDQECYISYVVYPNIANACRRTVKGFVTSGTEYYMVSKNLDIEL